MAFRRYANALPDPDWLEPVDHGRAAVRRGRDPIYLFACHLEWRDRGNLPAYYELTAALGDPDEGIRGVAEALLRKSPRRQAGEKTVEAW